MRVQRSIHEPIREGLSWKELWQGPDQGLIWCWERGRQERLERPADAERAGNGELILLDWRGCVRKKLKAPRASGSLKYLATWQGIRGENLDIDTEAEYTLECSRFGQAVVYSAKVPAEPDELD
jgi:hypothetical protein